MGKRLLSSSKPKLKITRKSQSPNKVRKDDSKTEHVPKTPSILELFKKQAQPHDEKAGQANSDEINSSTLSDSLDEGSKPDERHSQYFSTNISQEKQRYKRLSLKKSSRNTINETDLPENNVSNKRKLPSVECTKDTPKTINETSSPESAVSNKRKLHVLSVEGTEDLPNTINETALLENNVSIKRKLPNEEGSKDSQSVQLNTTLISPSPIPPIKKLKKESDIHGNDSVKKNQVNKLQENKTETLNDNDSEETDDIEFKVPYYLENFKHIIQSIYEDDYYKNLLNHEDNNAIEKFENVSENAQKLYVRLFGRKYKWILKTRIKYEKIAEDLSPLFDELVNAGILLDGKSLADLEDVLDVMAAPEIQNLAKSFKLNVKNQHKGQLKSAIIKHSKQKHLGGFFKKAADTANVVLARAKKLVGHCYRLVEEPRSVFARFMMLFSVHNVTGEEDEVAGQLQIFQMLMSNIGRIKYPTYTVSRETKIFEKREDLLRFEKAMQMHSDLYDNMENRKFDECLQIYETAKKFTNGIWTDEAIQKQDEGLPEYLRWFTAGAVCARILSHCVEVLQRKKMYADAVEQLEHFLKQKLYHPDYRGRWYDRLALNTEQHLKQPGKALDIIEEALKDDRVRAGHRLALFQRAYRICHANQHKKLHERWKRFEMDVMNDVTDAPKITIEGMQCPHTFVGEGRTWMAKEANTDGTEEVTLMKRVEDVVLLHFKENGYPEGIHGEGGTFTCLFCLFFWDIIFKDHIPDTFHSPYQSWPLDYATDYFYLNRKEEIDERLEEIKNSSEEELRNMMTVTWETHNGTLCSGLNWERFNTLEHAQGLAVCMGGPILAGIFTRLVKNMRHVRGGVPDLVVWNTETKLFRVVEVKGPNDRLSTKQILWLDYLVKLGVPAETCHVIAVGSKRLKVEKSGDT